MENRKEGVEFRIDTSKISHTEKGKRFKKATIESVLTELKPEEKKPFGPGDIVTTLEGPHAHKGLMVVELKDGETVRVAPAPNTPIIEIPKSELFHFDDYHEAFKVALVEEQILDPDKPQ